MTDERAQTLAAGLTALRLELDAQAPARLLAYLDLLAQWNKVYNLTALRDPDEMLTHHLLDSLAAIGPLRRHAAGRALRVLDVGSGGGLPGGGSCGGLGSPRISASARSLACCWPIT